MFTLEQKKQLYAMLQQKYQWGKRIPELNLFAATIGVMEQVIEADVFQPLYHDHCSVEFYKRACTVSYRKLLESRIIEICGDELKPNWNFISEFVNQ